MSKDDARTFVMRQVVRTMPTGSVDVMTVLDELQFHGAGRNVLFLESGRLAEMLLKARIRLDGTPLKLPRESFSVALPSDSGLPPFMVCRLTNEIRRKVAARLEKIIETGVDRLDAPHDHAVAICTRVDKGEYGRLSIPVEMMSAVAEADTVESASKILGTYPGGLVLSAEHMAVLLKQFRLLCALCAYVEARPEMLVDGLPSTVAPGDFPDRTTTSGPRTGMTIREPAGLGTAGGSKSTHFRTWYFRRYPRKKDGTRKDGMVFVEETVVNEVITPETLKEDNEQGNDS